MLYGIAGRRLSLCIVLWSASLSLMGICAGIVVAVTFKQVDDTPNAETCAESDDESLKYAYCACEKFHK